MVTKSRGIGRGIRHRYQGLTDAERLLERFVRQIEFSDESVCWLFKGVTIKGDYRQFKDERGRQVLAHRWAYEYFIGPISEGLTIDHGCFVTRCVYPGHLEAVTMRENILRGNGLAGQNARKTVAKCGHPFTMVEADGRRRCRPCYLAQMRRRAVA